MPDFLPRPLSGYVEEHHFYEEGAGPFYYGGKNCSMWYWIMYSGYPSDRPKCECPPGWPKLEAHLGTLTAEAFDA